MKCPVITESVFHHGSKTDSLCYKFFSTFLFTFGSLRRSYSRKSFVTLIPTRRMETKRKLRRNEDSEKMLIRGKSNIFYPVKIQFWIMTYFFDGVSGCREGIVRRLSRSPLYPMFVWDLTSLFLGVET